MEHASWPSYLAIPAEKYGRKLLSVMKAARWPCHYCDFECTSRDYLILHEECHLDEHRDRVTRQRTWCPRRAIYHSNSERPYQCTVCGQAFSQKMNLARHMHRHTGEKPYQCQLCPMRFNQKCNLERHVRCHTGERPFHCTFCAKSFNSKSNLSRHEACHLVRASPEMAALANFSV